ncbi:MAG TPA: DUF177 domain-containing protein [Propionibacteriaceae bacterium]|nr:DUF177 domain-containing protein [Propionibacteriaceae bacterium]
MTHRRQPAQRSGLVIETHELARSAGTMKTLRRTAEAPADLGIGVIGVPEGSPVDLDLRLEAVGEGVLVTGTAEVALTGECTRCLRPISDSMEIDIQELFYYPGNEPDDEAARIEGETINLEPVLRDAVVLDLPFAPLCTEDCRGICPVCGADLNDDPDHRHDDDVDPRWGSLQQWSATQE